MLISLGNHSLSDPCGSTRLAEDGSEILIHPLPAWYFCFPLVFVICIQHSVWNAETCYTSLGNHSLSDPSTALCQSGKSFSFWSIRYHASTSHIRVHNYYQPGTFNTPLLIWMPLLLGLWYLHWNVSAFHIKWVMQITSRDMPVSSNCNTQLLLIWMPLLLVFVISPLTFERLCVPHQMCNANNERYASIQQLQYSIAHLGGYNWNKPC